MKQRKDIKICKDCRWIDKVDSQHWFCPYIRCVKENGWIADKEKVNGNAK